MCKVIEKKIWPEYFKEVVAGNKTYELRLADFELKPGDILKLREWDPDQEAYTGREVVKEVGYIGRVSDMSKMYSESDIAKNDPIVISLVDRHAKIK